MFDLRYFTHLDRAVLTVTLKSGKQFTGTLDAASFGGDRITLTPDDNNWTDVLVSEIAAVSWSDRSPKERF